MNEKRTGDIILILIMILRKMSACSAWIFVLLIIDPQYKETESCQQLSVKLNVGPPVTRRAYILGCCYPGRSGFFFNLKVILAPFRTLLLKPY